MGAARGGVDRLSERIPSCGWTTSRPPKREVAAFAAAVHADGKGEQVWLVAADETAAAEARRACALRQGDRRAVRRHLAARHRARSSSAPARSAAPQGFGFNGWGGKYDLPGDDSIGERLAALGRPALRQGRLDPRRRRDRRRRLGHGPHHRAMPAQPQPQSADSTTQRSRHGLNATSASSASSGSATALLNDHTDGHVDNLARFVAPGRVAIPTAATDDPNAAVYARRGAKRLLDAELDVVTLPSPGRVEQRRRDHPGELHELLHRQRRGRRPALWRAQRRGRGRRRPGAVSRTAWQSACAPTIS